MSYLAASNRYDAAMPYRRVGRSGLHLPAVSVGLWQNFGDVDPLANQRAILRRAFDLGVTHFDLANNYGPPYGSAETNFGRLMAEDFKPYRDELVISTKAGYDMWPGPYGDFGSRKYLLASLDQSLARMGLDYVDIFYSHRADPETPLEETMGALHTAVTSGRALYAGISSYSPERTERAAAILADLGTPLLIHQPSYSMLNRWVEDGLLDTLGALGVGCIAFSPLAQGMLTDRYLDGDSGRFAGITRRVAVHETAHRRGSRTHQVAQRHRKGTRAVACSDGVVLGVARPAGDVGAGGRVVGAPTGGQPGCCLEPGLRRRGTVHHREARGGLRHQPLEPLQRCLSPANSADARSREVQVASDGTGRWAVVRPLVLFGLVGFPGLGGVGAVGRAEQL